MENEMKKEIYLKDEQRNECHMICIYEGNKKALATTILDQLNMTNLKHIEKESYLPASKTMKIDLTEDGDKMIGYLETRLIAV